MILYFITTHSIVKILLMFQWLKFDIKRNCFRLNYCVGQTTRKTKCLVHVTHGMSLETYHEMFADVQRRVRKK